LVIPVPLSLDCRRNAAVRGFVPPIYRFYYSNNITLARCLFRTDKALHALLKVFDKPLGRGNAYTYSNT